MNIVSSFGGSYREYFIFNHGGSQLREFLNQPGNYFCQVDGRLESVASFADAGSMVSAGYELYRITTGPTEIILLWNVRTKDSYDGTVRVTLSCVINDNQMLINYWRERLLALREIDQTTVANEVISYLREQVENDVRQYSFDQLTNENALPDSWWRKLITDGSLATMGLTIQTLSSSFSAPSAEVKKKLENLAQSNEAALKKVQIEANFE